MADLDPKFLKNNRWSFSRHRTWNHCRRQFYFDYIAPHIREPAPVDTGTLQMLKSFNSRFVLQGQVIHDILNEQIGLHCDRMPMDPSGAVESYVHRIAQNRVMATELLTEYRHGEPVSETFFASINESGRRCLETFFQNIWPEYRDRDCLRHEKFDRFTIGDTGVIVRVDYVSRMENGLIVLTDWKTGFENNRSETELQMATYVLWAMQYYGKAADEVMGETVFLNTGRKKTYPFFEEELHEVQEVIRREFMAMNSSYEFGDYPPTPISRECVSCRFARICPDSGIR